MNKKTSRLKRARKGRCQSVRLRIPRLSVHRTPSHIYAQVIMPNGNVVASAATVEKDIKSDAVKTGNAKAAGIIGKVVAERAQKAGIKKVAFDRSGFKYHGRIKALAEAAREAGLEF